QPFVFFRRIFKVFRPANQECQPLRRRRATNIVAKLVAVASSFFDVDQDEVIQVCSPPGTSFYYISGAVYIDSEFSHNLGTQVAFVSGSVHQKHSLLLERTGELQRNWQRGKWSIHAVTDLDLARDEASFDLSCAVPIFSNSRVRFRRAIFCFRSRLNLDLSP